MAFIQIEEMDDRILGRIIRNKKNENVPVDILKQCTCIHIGSRGQTLFNFTVSIPGTRLF